MSLVAGEKERVREKWGKSGSACVASLVSLLLESPAGDKNGGIKCDRCLHPPGPLHSIFYFLFFVQSA